MQLIAQQKSKEKQGFDLTAHSQIQFVPDFVGCCHALPVLLRSATGTPQRISSLMSHQTHSNHKSAAGTSHVGCRSACTEQRSAFIKRA
jgi:hypothetical protein